MRNRLSAVAACALLLLACTAEHERLIDAAEAGEIEVVERLIAAGVDVDGIDGRTNQVLGVVTGDTALREASAHGHSDIVRLLLDAGADPGIADRFGWTPLLSATTEGHADCVRALLEGGAAVDGTNDLGRSALWLAVARDDLELVRLLVAAGADPELTDDEGVSPSARASSGTSHEVRAALAAGDAPRVPPAPVHPDPT